MSDNKVDLTAIRDDINATTEKLHAIFEQYEAEKKAKNGSVAAKTVDTMTALQAQMSELTNRMQGMETKMARPELVAPVVAPVAPAISAKSNFFNYMRKGLWGLKAVPSDALVETASNVSPFGEILVPEELEKEIMRALPPLTIMRNLASVRTIASDRLRIRSMNEAVVGWNKLETTDAALAASLMTPAEEYQYAEDLYGLVKVGEDELQDADQNLQAIIADSFARAIAYAEDAAFIAGTGHAAGAQPTGIVNSACNAIAAKQAGAVTADDFLSLVYALPVQYRQSASFIVNSRTELALRMLKDGKGQYLWQPSVQQGRPNTFFGYPIYNQEAVADIPAAGTTAKVAVFGDIKSAYRIIDHTGMTMKRMDELYAEHGLIGFRVHKRVGGSVVRTDAARILQVPSA